MKNNYTTSRLNLIKLGFSHSEFILELINTPEWITYIGNRNIKTKSEVTEYIQKIIDSQNIKYWVVILKEECIPIGIITFIKRDYLEYCDIGFAFLKPYTKKGYAHEATFAVLEDAMKENVQPTILATTIKENVNSIQLLEKLGFRFFNAIEKENTPLMVYSISTGKGELLE